ncbi:hypothetical protein FB463_002747 [Frigoribacterium faeni]|uniref:Uncharacterized protein n=1 Tax=Frigoribacterium faeni TaxID=145483 RepID=A0A7W3JKP5_9MICO|nr:hypothetical protein [Frigoribacterium faeni]
MRRGRRRAAPRPVHRTTSSPGDLYGTRCGGCGGACRAPHRVSCTAPRLVHRTAFWASHRVPCAATRLVRVCCTERGAVSPVRPLTRRTASRARHRVSCVASGLVRRTASRASHRVPCTAPRLVRVRCTERGAVSAAGRLTRGSVCPTASRALHCVAGVAPRGVRCTASSPGAVFGTRCGECGGAADASHRVSCTAPRFVHGTACRASHRVGCAVPRLVRVRCTERGAMSPARPARALDARLLDGYNSCKRMNK